MLCFVVAIGLIQAAVALDNGLAQTPPMGWCSWNHFHRNFNASLFIETADAMAANGMKEAGYQYINVGEHQQKPVLASPFCIF